MSEMSGCEMSAAGGAIMRRLNRALVDLRLSDLFESSNIIYDGETFALPKLSHEVASRIATRLEQLSESIENKTADPEQQVTTIFETDHQAVLNKELTEFHAVPVGYAVALVKVAQ